MYHYTNSRIHNFYLNNGFIKTRQRAFWKFSNRGTLSRLIVTSRGTLRDFRNTSARSTSLLILPPFFTVFLTTAQISLLRFLTGLIISPIERGFVTRRIHNWAEWIVRLNQFRHPMPGSGIWKSCNKQATEPGHSGVPDNYGHRSARLRLRSRYKIIGQRERLTKGSETVLSVPDLGAVKVRRGRPLPFEMEEKISARYIQALWLK